MLNAKTWRLFVKKSNTCGECRTTIERDTIAWWARHQAPRCVDCGPHPEHKVNWRKPVAPKTHSAADVAAIESLTRRVACLQTQLEAVRRQAPVVTIVEVKTPKETKRVEGAHKSLKPVLRLVSAGIENIFLVGPAGTGKTTLAEQAANALGLQFGFLSFSEGVTETQLLGRSVPNLTTGENVYHASRFIEVYEQGGVFLLDEFDGIDPNVGVAINAALANGVLANPISGRQHKRHKDCIVIAAANTYGTGGDAMYQRNKLDSASLDRFVGAFVEVGYDTEVETKIAAAAGADGANLCAWVWRVRKNVLEQRMRRVAGTRMIVTGTKKLVAGFTLDEVVADFLIGWSDDERRKAVA